MTRRHRWMLFLAAVVVTVSYLIPVYWMVNTSFKQSGDIFDVPPDLFPLPPTIAAYADAVFTDPDIARGLINSVIIATGSTALTLAIALPAAYGLARLRVRFMPVVLMLFLVVQMVPSVNLALPMFVLLSGIGLVNNYLGLIIAICSTAIPLAVVILRPYFLSVPSEMIEAARIDGCTELGAFTRVALPISLPGVITIAVVGFQGAWGEFVFGLALAPDDAYQPVTVVLAKHSNDVGGTEWNEVMAASAIVALPVIIIFILLQRYVVAGLTEGATRT